MSGTALLAIHTAIAVIPVTLFLLALIYLDSYKLVRLGTIMQLIAAGGVAAFISFLINTAVAGAFDDARTFTILAAPLIEEIVKAIPLIILFRARRIGFMVDAAIFGFAIGAGFAVVENWYYLWALPESPVALWLVRGFGTGIMHGGSTAILALTAKVFTGGNVSHRAWSLVPGVLVAYGVHAAFNSFVLPPVASALAVIVLFPPLVIFVFAQSERALQEWLGTGFDVDAELLERIGSGEFVTTPAGLYLHSLRERFDGPVVADMLCYLRLHAELALRAKGILMMRENGFAVPHDAELTAKLVELRYLARNIGKTGTLALAPILHASAEDVWQLQLLEQP